MRSPWPLSAAAVAVLGLVVSLTLFHLGAGGGPPGAVQGVRSTEAPAGPSVEDGTRDSRRDHRRDHQRDHQGDHQGGAQEGAQRNAQRDAQRGALPGARPNVLVVEADDMRADDLRFMPRVRRLIARTGISFENSFAPNPLCCPSRASFLTGQYSHNHGVLSHTPPYGFSAFDDSDTLATRLQDVGYSTALVGKYLNGYGEDPVRRSGRPSLHYVPPGWTEWYGSTDRRWPEGSAVSGGTYDYFALTSNVNGTIATWPGQYTTDVTARQTRGLIRTFSRTPAKPWFIWWTPVAPHEGSPVEPDDDITVPTATGRLATWGTPARPDSARGRFDSVVTHGSGIPVTHAPEPDKTDKPRYLRNLPGLTAQEVLAVRDMTRQRAEALWVLDRQVSKTLTSLHRAAVDDDTIVVFTSDNGFYLGEHDKRLGKATPHEPSIRVPLLMTGPGVPAGRRFDPVTTIDLAPTIASWAGATLKDPDGVDLSPTIEHGDQGWRRAVVLEGRMFEAAYNPDTAAGRRMRFSVVGVRTGRYKVVTYSTGETELYDLATDPLELDNLRPHDVPPRTRHALMAALRYVSCDGASCRRPLPAPLIVDPRAERLVTVGQRRAEAAYYDRRS